jgi:hypothetical protein
MNFKDLKANQYPGTCCVCKRYVPRLGGFVKPVSGVWAVYHPWCLPGIDETPMERRLRERDEAYANMRDDA